MAESYYCEKCNRTMDASQFYGSINLAKYLYNKYPDADLRIFNNNMKDISLKIIDENLLSGNTVGFYIFVFYPVILLNSYQFQYQ